MWSRHNSLVIVTSSAIDCDVLSRTKTMQVRHWDDVRWLSFLSSFMDSFCRVRNKIMYVLSWRTVSVLTQVLFWCLFPSLLRNSGDKHQKNPLVGVETVRHSSTYIILYIFYTPIIEPLFHVSHWYHNEYKGSEKVWVSDFNDFPQTDRRH